MRRKISEIASVLGLPQPEHEYDIDTLLTDSRELDEPAGTLFFAIKTSGNDGHRYIKDLYSKGVRNFVVADLSDFVLSAYISKKLAKEEEIAEDVKKDFAGANFLVVDDVVKALQRIAVHPADFKGNVLAITGSRGKTTLKEWLYQLMEPLGNISRSPRSYNSQIGVPLSMWDIDEEASFAIIEAGISHKGEMKALADIIRPDTVIITNIGDAHSEGFENDAEKAREKLLLASDGATKTIIYNADNKLISNAVSELKLSKKLIRWLFLESFENQECSEYAELPVVVSKRDDGFTELTYRWDGDEYKLKAPLDGPSDFENAANALAFMLSCSVKPDVIAERFESLHKIGTRLNVTEGVNGCVVIHDSYTSDFSSLRPALHFARRRQPKDQGLTLILSDLHHEAEESERLYERIARLVEHSGVTRLIGIGTQLKRFADIFAPGSEFYSDVAEFMSVRSASDFGEETILLKGSPESNFDEIAAMLEARRHETVLEVNLDAIVANYNYFRRQLPKSTGIVCMVKASGYGAGSYEIAKTLQDCGAKYLAVAVLDEGVELRNRGISMPIMVMNPRVENYRAMFANHLEPEIYSMSMLHDVIREARKNSVKGYPIHIKLDTGMHRMGFIEDELPELMDILMSTEEVTARSVFSHLATADCPEMNDYTEMQLDRFARWTEYIESRSDHHVLRHVLNSAGILRYPEHHYDLARLGIGLYGANTLPPEIEKPLAVVSTLRTVIIAIREWKAGESIGYARRGMLTRDSRIATIPIGYADGMNRHFGNGAIRVIVNGQEAPTVGNICMDACMIDVTGIECKEGDSVEIFGRQASVGRLAEALDTIPYEIFTSVSPRVKRVYYRE